MVRLSVLLPFGLAALLFSCAPPSQALSPPAEPKEAAPPPKLAPPQPACTIAKAPPIPLSPAKAQEITVEQLARMLPRHPVIVGFDVDDTLTFSAPAFNALEPKYDPDVIRPKDGRKLTEAEEEQYHAFWNEINERLDDRSIPKKIGKALLDLHIARGDDIYIISRRQATVPPSDAVTSRLMRFFQVKLLHPVVQTNLGDKTRYICERRIEYYYGDSDSDITAAVAAGATPIRVRRAADSYAKDKTHNGELDEIVLKDSEQ